MNNIQKSFKTKSKLRGMADGGQVDSRVLGSGMAQRAGSALQGRRAQLDAAIDAASGAPPRPAPTPAAAAPAKKPEGKSALRSFFGLADGGSPADVDRIMNSRDMSIFTPQEMKTFNGMGQAAMADAAQMQDVGVQAGQAALAAARPAELPAVGTDDMAPPEIELADGGKVRGKGGPTDDKVGPVALSDGEYVLPADTVDIVGRDKLDALRLATHDFVDEDNKPKVSRLRKMANGGIVVEELTDPSSRRAFHQARAAVQAGNQFGANTLLRDVPRPAVTPPPAAAAPAPAPALAPTPATSSLRTALNSGGGRVGGFVRGALPVAAIGGAVDSFADVGSGYRDKFNESVGATGPVSSVAGDAARVMGNVGDAITFGLAGRLGRGLSSIGTPEGFSGGFMSESDRDKYNREQVQRVMGQQAPAAAAAPQSRPGELPGMSNVPADVRTSSAGMPAVPVQPQSYQSRRLAEMGVPVDQQNLAPVTDDTRRSLLREGGGTPGQYVNLGSYGGDANIYGTASKPGGRIDSFTGVGASSRPGGGPQEDPIMGEIRSALRGLTDGAGNRGGGGGASIGSGNASEINARYDKLASQLSGMYGPKGQGNLARRLLELEQSRSGALDADARNQSALRGQDMSASTAANSANMQARMQALQTLGTMANQRSAQSAQDQAAAAKAQADAAKASEGRSKDAVASMNEAIDRFSAGDKNAAVELANVVSRLPKDLRAAIDALPASDRPGAWASAFAAYNAQPRGFAAGRDPGAMVQNTVLGAGVGASMPGIGRGIGYAGDLVGTLLTKGRYRGTVLRDLLGSRAGSAVLGAGVGALTTPKTQTTGLLNLPMAGEDGLPIQADATFIEGLQHGFYDTNKPWATLQRGEDGNLQAIDYTDDELAAIRDLTSLRRFGRE